MHLVELDNLRMDGPERQEVHEETEEGKIEEEEERLTEEEGVGRPSRGEERVFTVSDRVHIYAYMS